VDNLGIAIYQMLNELARRHDLRPSNFRATYGRDSKSMDHALRFVWPAEENAEMQTRYRVMLINLGIPIGENTPVGSGDRIYEALERALKQVPEKRPRGR
jgi:hypothetical protein